MAFFHNMTTIHIGLRVETPDALLALYHELKARGPKPSYVWNHRFALAIFVSYPKGTLIEVYWPTGREDYASPYVEPLDLEGQTDESLRQMVASMPGRKQSPSARVEDNTPGSCSID